MTTPNTNPTTPQAAAQAATPAHPLIAALTVVDRGTPLTEQQCIARGLPSTSKSKARMGIDNDREIIWNHANFSPNDNNILIAFCKSQNIRTCDLLARVCMTWFENNRAEITAAADGFIKAENTAEDVLKGVVAAQNKIARSLAALGIVIPEGKTLADIDLAAEIAKAMAPKGE